jgi:predicted extracellular nuclease
VASLAQEIQADWSTAPVIVLGDLNDGYSSQPIQVLTSQGFSDLLQWADPSSQYTYIYRGLSEGLDYVLAHLPHQIAAANITPVHINADYPYVFSSVNGSHHRSSDHDPLLVQFKIRQHLVYLPVCPVMAPEP